MLIKQIIIHDANIKANVELIQALINAKANANQVDKDGTTPLIHVIEVTPLISINKNQCIQALINAKVDVNQEKKSDTSRKPLAIARQINCVDCVNTLVRAGATE